MKKLSSIFFVKYLLIGIYSLSFVNLNAQTCDENVLKGLENTRIYYHKEVTKGSNASFFIKNPLKGTTYSFIDKATGVAYSKLYTGVPEELTIEIPVGKVTTEQYFLFRATNGDCTYQSSDHRDVNKRYYVITPDTQTKLSLSVEHEWCAHSGAVHINMVGDDNAHYNFFFKKPNGNFEQLANHSYTSLDAGTYEVKAVNKNDSSKVYTKKVEVEKFTKNIDFQLSSVVDVCTGKLAIYVDTQKGKTGVTADNSYPLFFTLLKNNVEIKNQTSPLFKDVEEGATYEVRVYDVCGTSGGNFSTQTYKVTKRLGVFKVTNHSGFSPKANCPYMVSFSSELYVKDAREMVEKNLIPYPLAFTFEMTSPSNKVYHFSFVVNNKQELEENFTPTENSFSLRPLKLSNNNIPYESGKWKLKGTYTICGKQDVISETEKEVFLPITGVGIGTAQDDLATGCRNQKLVLTNSNNLQPLKNFYTVLENAPAGFDYQAAGFYKITTTNPLLQNKWVKFFENTDGRKTLLPAKFVEEGGDYKFKVVDECTNTTKDLSYTGYATSQGLFELKAKVYATCSDPSGAPDNNSLWKEVVLERGNTTDGTITKVEIISYEKDSRFADYSALMPVALPIDITETYRSGEQQWRIKLPAGVYNVRWSGSCNKTGTLKVQTGGTENTTFEWQDGCNPKLIVKRNTSYSLTQGIEYILERYDTKENRWVSVTYGYYGGDTYLDARRDRFEFNIPNPQQGKYRVLRSIQPDSRNRFKECTRVVAEHEFTEGEMQQPKGVRMDCSAIGGAQKYHIAIIPQGGVPPYTYELSEAEIDGSTTNAVYQNNSDNNFFINIDASKPQARYKFLVKDSCGKGKVYEETLSQIAPFAVQKNQEFYCVGSKGVLSVPQISGVSYQWYRNDQPTTVLSTSNELVINNLTQDDLDNSFSLKLTLTNITDPKVKSCIEQNLNGFDTIRFNTHTPYSQTYKAPIAVNRVECLGETNNSVNNIYDVNKLFKDVPTSFEAGVSYDIIDKDGLISTTRMDYLGVKDMIKMSPALVGKHTFIYRIKSACGSVITQTEATLEVKTYRQIYATSINVCEATKTLAELETIIKNTNTGITTSMFGNDFEFQWYPTSEDANKETNRITTPSLSLSEGNNQYYIKGKHIGDSFCFSSPAQVNIMRLSSSSKGDKTITLCEGTTITDLKKEIAKPSTSDVNKVAVYKGTTLLSNDDVLQTGIQYTYTYKVGTCETPSANINLTLTPITPIPPVESLVVCDYEVENLSYYTTYAVVMNYLQTKYAGKTVKLYQSFGPYNIPQVQPTDKVFLNNDRFSYTLQEAGKCESVRQKIIVVADINRAIATTVAISVCEEDKVSAIRAKLIGDNIKIYKKLRTSSQNAVLSTEVNDNEDIDWTEGIEYFYTVKKPGDTCESRKERIFLSKSLGGKTLAQPASLSLCKSSATIADLKVALQGNETKIYTLNLQNKYVEEIDTTVLNATTAYYYTLRDVGKCVSDKAPITFALLQRPAPPTVTQTTHTLCSGTNQTIASLQPQGANIVWYATATATTPLAKTTPLVAGTTYYVAQKNGTCESDRVAVAVTQGTSGNETLVFSTPFSKTLKCVPSGQLRFQVQNAVAGQSYVVELTQVPAGYTGSRTFTITKDNKEGNVPFVWLTQNNIPKGTYKARLVKCGVSQEIGQTITELTSNFPIRDNFDAGPYVDVNDCNYANLRNSQARAGGIDINAYFQNEAIAKQFFEYTAVSPQDMTDKGWTNASQIPDSYWREVYSLPAGITSSQPKVIYYDLAAFGRNYADLAIANKKPKFYFRIKGQPSCGVSAPIEFGDTRMLTMKMAYGGSCTAPTIKISLDRTVIVCKPITYEVKNEAGQVVASGSTNVANAIIDITNLNGNPINPNEKYSVTVKAAAPDTQSVTTIARSFNQAKAAYRPDGQYAEIKRCFGHPERTEMYIQGFLRDENGVLLSLKGYKVTLESAPAGYANEPNKLKVGESYTITRDASSYNLLSTLNVQNAAGFSSLPEGDYKIKIEDPCGQTYYVENGRRKKANLLTIEHPQYSEKPLTPEKEVACTGVKVYPFKGNTAQDWLKKNNQNQNLYVWLVKIPAGVNAADISTTPQQPGTYAGNTYQRAIYSRDNAATLNTYFTLPRNENSTGLYTFAYAEDEREIYNYIANSPTACVRTFTISVDDVLLNIDRSTYVGYKCEGGTGKIVVKAVNGINDANNYTYELYATKTGTVIETKTAVKGTTVTFTNLGTFTAGQNTRWLKLTDASCPTQSMWRELPIDILEKPANGKTYTFCAAATVAELKAKVATDTATVNVYKNGTLVTNNNEVLNATAAYTVSRFNATCETDKVAVTVTISNTVSLTVPATLTVTCTAANIDTTVNNWLGQATVTDTCGTATLTHDFAAVKPTNWCNTSVVTVTFVGKDPQGNTVTKTSVINVNSTPIVAKVDTYTLTNGTSTTTTTGTVLDNDKLGTKTPTTTDVILTVVTTTTDVVGATKTPTLNNDGTITVPSGTKSGTYEIVYSICERLNPNNCTTATATVKVGSTPIVAKADTYTITNGTSTTTTTGTVLDNDKLGTKTPTTT
ncbi:immunoglobulin domain-containing protein, partial [Capnocytophaga sputigena]|uniref:immunoglobulin domain-containing protein n=1 Tax=Capnocytophaga sputigena TaxID=1019 RepID=UPI00241C7F72